MAVSASGVMMRTGNIFRLMSIFYWLANAQLERRPTGNSTTQIVKARALWAVRSELMFGLGQGVRFHLFSLYTRLTPMFSHEVLPGASADDFRLLRRGLVWSFGKAIHMSM
jgi:hypothetical protein